MRFGISLLFWIYCIFCEASSWNASAYFGLTGKNRIPDLSAIDQEAVFMGDNKRENLYQWNEKGYYTAPSKSYERIDLSPQSDDQATSSHESRSTKNTWQKKPRSTPDRMPMNSRRQYLDYQDDIQVKPSPSSNHYRRHAEPRPHHERTRFVRDPLHIRRRNLPKQTYLRDSVTRYRENLYDSGEAIDGLAQSMQKLTTLRPQQRHQSKYRIQARKGAGQPLHRQDDVSTSSIRQDVVTENNGPKKTSDVVSTQLEGATQQEGKLATGAAADSSLPPEISIRPLFVTDDISSIMPLITVDSNGQMKLNSENIQSQASLSKTEAAGSAMKARTKTIPLLPVEDIDRKLARKQCDGLTLTKKQRRLCKKDSGLPQILREAMVMSVSECQYQFRFERWNCTIGRTRVHLLSRGNKETAFLYAISSAGLVHSVARGCAKGYLERCLCDETYSDYVNEEAWMWGGCGDNVQAAAKFVRQFLRPKARSEDIRAEVDKHNSDLGIRMVRHSVTKTCKCHGVSGSCTTKTCWRKVSPFYDIGRRLKLAYAKSVKVGSVNSAGGKTKLVKLKRTRRNRPEIPRQNTWNAQTDTDSRSLDRKTLVPNDEPSQQRESATTQRNSTILMIQDSPSSLETNPRNSELVYLENSPQYCRRTRYSLGTKGRRCNKHKNCKEICCGRGYTTRVHTVHRSCECEVRWCCYVECKTCLEKIEVHTCK